MPGFQTERPEPRGYMISLRVTNEQNELLMKIGERLGDKSKSEVLRIALDYWLASSPDGIAALAPTKKRRS